MVTSEPTISAGVTAMVVGSGALLGSLQFQQRWVLATMPHTRDVHDTGIAVDAIENPIIVTMHLAMYSTFSRIPRANVRKSLKNFDSIDDRESDLSGAS